MPIPEGNHNDWLWPFSYIPRKWTAIESEEPPTKIFGNTNGNLDVPKPGQWTLSSSPYGPMFAWTSVSGWHFRIGTARYDYVDRYYQFPTLALKKITF